MVRSRGLGTRFCYSRRSREASTTDVYTYSEPVQLQRCSYAIACSGEAWATSGTAMTCPNRCKTTNIRRASNQCLLTNALVSHGGSENSWYSLFVSGGARECTSPRRWLHATIFTGAGCPSPPAPPDVVPFTLSLGSPTAT